MLGLFGKGNVTLSVVQKRYEDDKAKLLALLQSDLKIIATEQQKIEEAINALKGAKSKMDAKHLQTIKARLDVIHQNILWADKLAGEGTAHRPAETTTLSELGETADEILSLLKSTASKGK